MPPWPCLQEEVRRSAVGLSRTVGRGHPPPINDRSIDMLKPLSFVAAIFIVAIAMLRASILPPMYSVLWICLFRVSLVRAWLTKSKPVSLYQTSLGDRRTALEFSLTSAETASR